jgi:dienelactone hydrolase
VDVNTLPQYRFPNSASGRKVIRAGDPSSPRPVILLHELGGLAQATVDYAAALVDAGCVVHMPLVFGSVGQQSAVKGSFQLCWSRQLTLLFSDRRPRLADWLATFCDHIRNQNGHPVVVIGMCATGGVVFSVLMNDSVGGAVAAQPSLPFRPAKSGPNLATLGATVADVTASAESGKPFVALRYQEDRICPAGRLIQIAETFGEDNTMEVPGNLHSTLVYDQNDDARQRVLALLDEVFGAAG